MKFFKNPPGRRKRRTAAQKAATRKLVALNKRKRRAKKKGSVVRRKARRAVTRKVRRRTIHKGAKMARRRKSTRSRARKRAPVRRRRSVSARRRRGKGGSIHLRRITGKVYRSNPGGIVKQVVQGVKDAGYVLGGGAATRMVSNIVPVDKTGLMGTAVQLASALAVGMVARRFLGADAARFVIAGGMQVPVKSLVTSVIPAAAPLLGDYDMLLSYPGVGSYPALAGDGTSDGMGSYTEDGIASYGE